MISKPADINPFQTSRCVRSDIELLPDWEASLPHGRLWTLVRGGAGVLGAGQQPGGALLLDDLHPAQGHPGDSHRSRHSRH